MPKQITYEKDGYIYTYDLIECPSPTFNGVELPNDDIITKDGQVISTKLYGYKLVYTNEPEILTGIIVTEERLNHSVLGEFNSNGRLINGGHGQANIEYLKRNNIEFNIVKEYDNGVRVGNIPSHKNKFKRIGTGQAWFPKNWSETDIKSAGEYVVNLPENTSVGDGVWVFGEYKGVRVGVIKNEGKIGTIIPDNSRQP